MIAVRRFVRAAREKGWRSLEAGIAQAMPAFCRSDARRRARRFVTSGAAAVAAAAALAGCTSSTELAAIRSQLDEVKVEVLRLQKQGPSKDEMAAMEAGLGHKIDDLAETQGRTEIEIRELAEQIVELQAKLEDTNFRLAQLAQQIAATNQELQAVRNAAEVARTTTQPPPETANPTDPQALYDQAYTDYGRGNYDLAVLGFSRYLESYGGTDLADNAAYWIGECFLRQGKYQKAIDQFDQVLTRWERSDRTPSALLQKGLAYFELGQQPQGVVQLQNVICEFGGTDEAHLARQKLQELGIEIDC